MEGLHSLPWNALGLASDDPHFVATFEGAATAALPVTSTPDARIPRALHTVRRGATDFTVRVHVVRLPDSDATRLREAQRRMTVLVRPTALGGARQVRVDSTRTPTTGESGNQCFGLRSLEVAQRDAAGTISFDPFALTGDRVVATGSALVVTATTNVPASGVTLTYPRIDVATSTVGPVTVAMQQVGADDRRWEFTLPPLTQLPAAQQTFTASGTASTTSPACPAMTATLDAYAKFTYPAGAAPTGLRVATGADHSCWIDGAGRAWCWGKGSGNGVLGIGNSNPSQVPVQVGVGVAGFSELTSISAGDEHTCAVTAAGAVWCWGLNTVGQLGDGTTSTQTSPVRAVGLSDAVAVSAGSSSTCAVTRAGLVRCWGGNALGQLGNGTLTPAVTPSSRVLGMDKAIDVSTGTDHACAVTASGGVWCWGSGAALRLNGAPSSTSPVQITLPGSPSTLARQVSINTGSDAHTCVVVTTGQVFCWGANEKGQAAPGAAPVTSLQAVTGLPVVQHISAGLQFTCARATLASGAIEGWCWGFNNKGQLGNDGFGGSTPPTRVFTSSGMDGLVDLAASDSHTCARLFDASAWCWGHNANGKLGNGTSTDSTRPVRVSGT